MSRRTERLASTIQQEIGMMILRDLSDPRLTSMTSVTRVKVTDDLSYADVYISTMGTPGEKSAALHALQHSASLIRGKLTKALSLRQAPYLRFHIDEDLKKELAMMELLDQVAKENEELDRRRAAQGEVQGGSTPGAAGGDGQ